MENENAVPTNTTPIREESKPDGIHPMSVSDVLEHVECRVENLAGLAYQLQTAFKATPPDQLIFFPEALEAFWQALNGLADDLKRCGKIVREEHVLDVTLLEGCLQRRGPGV